jgi:hypothetical protein
MASAMAGAPFLHESGHRSHGRWDCTFNYYVDKDINSREKA